MNAKKYPKLAWSRQYKGNPKCWTNAVCPCGQPATHKVQIQTSPFRGDDEHESRCDAHALMAATPTKEGER